jgi:hypothetical protein
MHNPYEPPVAPAVSPGKKPGKERGYLQLALSLLIALFCTLQMWGILFLLIRNFGALVQDGSVPLLALGAKLTLPLLLFVSGILLLFQRKLALYGFGVYLVGVVLLRMHNDYGTSPLTLLPAVGFLAYALYLYKRGRLV